MVLGVTGPLCSGKSEAAAVLRSRGWRVIDADKVGHAVLRRPEVVRRLARLFGEAVLDGRGRIDRAKLGAVVFADRRLLRRLERVVHPLMVEAVRQRLAGRPGKDTVLEAAVLHRMGLHRLCDAVLLVTARHGTLLERARRRGVDPAKAGRILALQDFSGVFRTADAVVSSEGDRQRFRRAVLAAAEALRAAYGGR